MTLKFRLNGRMVEVKDVAGEETLLNVLREYLGLKGTKEGCGIGECGACTVLLDGAAVDSCLTAAWKANGKDVTTIGGLARKGELSPLQKAFLETGAVQCGFCTPGMVLSAQSLLNDNPDPTDEEIKTSLAGNICRCTGYQDIIEAVKKAARQIKEDA
ncbi:(2Fe-2S)-binding protein [Dethiosulfatarculus sandiegensis]|uniref:(2Fe-2S)-binding protein n=1 Tax=Dethiosulfatarculus sandiegensis TaxID=1429043 RepID=A0A0D2HN52_9BACT|nr:(2Fe-2S)-binding protein [Dethiosulfatarculus sandiegensis]KIX11973.1 (2Fe-2S)-binding protein [Dethiosulfatarculus sandiegensis]